MMDEALSASANGTAAVLDSEPLKSDEDEVKYKPGDVIQERMDFFVKTLNNNGKGKNCDTCFKTSSHLLRCNRCKLVWYCDKTCQTKDWHNCHKLECKFLTVYNDEEDEWQFKRQTLRLHFHLMMHPGRAEEHFKMYDGSSRCFKDLTAKMEDGLYLQNRVSKDPWLKLEVLHMKEVASLMRRQGLLVATCDREAVNYIKKLWATWLRFNIKTFDVGSGIFVPFSCFKHSCKPNAQLHHVSGSSFQVEVRVIADIKRGEQPRIDLSNWRNILPFKERQAFIRDGLGFTCKCERCLDEKVNGDAVDYSELNKLMHDLKANNWKDYLIGHNKAMKMLRTLFHRYDQRIGKQVWRSMKTLSSDLAAPATKLDPIVKEFKAQLIVEGLDVVGAQKLISQFFKSIHFTNFVEAIVQPFA